MGEMGMQSLAGHLQDKQATYQLSYIRHKKKKKEPIMIRSVFVLAFATVCLGQQVPTADDDSGKLFFGAFGTRTSILLSSSTIIRYTTCTWDVATGVTDCRRRKRSINPISVAGDVNDDDIASSIALEKDLVTGNKEGKLNFYKTVTTTVMTTTTSYINDVTVSVRPLCIIPTNIEFDVCPPQGWASFFQVLFIA